MSTVVSTPLSSPPVPVSALPVGVSGSGDGPRALTDDVFQTAEEAVLAQSVLPAAEAVPFDVEHGGSRRGVSLINRVRSHVAAKPCEAALLAAAAGAMATWVLRRRLGG